MSGHRWQHLGSLSKSIKLPKRKTAIMLTSSSPLQGRPPERRLLGTQLTKARPDKLFHVYIEEFLLHTVH